MANFAFTSFKNQLLGTGTHVDFAADTIKAMFVDQTDDVPAVGDDFIDDIASAGRVPAEASTPTLTSPTIGTVAAGTFDAADTVFTALTGDVVESLLLYKDTGTEATSSLLVHWDTGTTGLPLTPNGADVTVVWNASGIITIA